MPITWLDHKELKIVKGVYIAPGDTKSVENPVVTLNLMSNTTGISLEPDGWSPNIPSLKSGGVWADSPISDGRTLLSGVNGNVTETMRVNIIGNSYQELMQYMSALRNMMQDCRDFWQTNAQINPVFLHWFARVGAGKQYALIYNIDADFEYVDSPTPTIEATLTIERECFWRSIPPGANPRQWTFESRSQTWDYTKTALGTLVGDDLAYRTGIPNRSEYAPAPSSALLSSNFLTIPASSIPGDAPALVNMMINTGSLNIIIGKKSIKIPNGYQQNLTFNAADSVLGTDATIVGDAGASIRGTTGVNDRVEVSFATATNQLRLTTNQGAFTNRMIGRFMVFMRCRQQGGTLGDITMYLRYGMIVSTNTDGMKLNVVNPPVIAGAGASTNWGLVYMGIITSPPTVAKAEVNTGSQTVGEARGLENVGTSNCLLGLFALRSAGAAPLYINDIILIPVDEGSITLENADASPTVAYVYDETGYFAHGITDLYAINLNSFTSPLAGKLALVSGQGIQLTPNVENRLYTIQYDASDQSQIATTYTIGVNIVPRWQGIRGV